MKKTATANYRFGRVHMHIIPVLVWLATVACVVVLFTRRSQRFELLGIAHSQMYQVCSPVDGRLKTVAVELFEQVGKGQILATMDDAQLNAQIAIIHAQIQHLGAQLLASRDTMQAEAANLETDAVAAQRRYCVDVENARLRILELKALVEFDRIMAEDLALEVKIAENLLNQDAIAPYELQKAQVQYNALAGKIEENEHLLTQAQQHLKQSQQRREEFAQLQPVHPSVENAIDPIRKEITVQEKLVDEILLQRQALTIKSPVDGMVTRIQVNANQMAVLRPGEDVLRRPGEIILAGEQILVVAKTQPTEVVAYVGEEQLAWVKERLSVKLIKNTDPPQMADSQVISLGPAMELMPQRLWQNPNIAQWGRAVVIKIPPGLKLLPGQTVGIKGL
jgi:multidrug resistance efflux pump